MQKLLYPLSECRLGTTKFSDECNGPSTGRLRLYSQTSLEYVGIFYGGIFYEIVSTCDWYLVGCLYLNGRRCCTNLAIQRSFDR